MGGEGGLASQLLGGSIPVSVEVDLPPLHVTWKDQIRRKIVFQSVIEDLTLDQIGLTDEIINPPVQIAEMEEIFKNEQSE